MPRRFGRRLRANLEAAPKAGAHTDYPAFVARVRGDLDARLAGQKNRSRAGRRPLHDDLGAFI